MKQSKKIHSGDFWSTRSSSTIPGMLVFLDWKDANTLLGYPMFAETCQATSNCYHLVSHPDYACLLDERWINFATPVKIRTDALFDRLGHSQYTLDCLHALQNGKDIQLTNGIPCLSGIGDPREHFQTELSSSLKKLAGVTFAQLTIDMVKNTLWCHQAQSVKDFLASVGQDATFGASTGVAYSGIRTLTENCSLPYRLFKAGAKSIARKFDSSTSKVSVPPFLSNPIMARGETVPKGIVMDIDGKAVMIQMNAHGRSAYYCFSGAELTSAEICQSGNDVWQRVPMANAGTFVTSPGELHTFKLQVGFDDGTTEILDFSLENA